ncbi:MAG: NrdJb [Venatoribacter sp.]
MSIKLDSKIVSFQVVKADEPAKVDAPTEPTWEEMHEHLKRPQHLEGTTYKVKPPISEHAIYVTINDVVLNKGSERETRRPFEIFINSKNMEHYQWISALTLIISAVFRKGGDCTFLVEELGSVFDPKGGYMKRGGRWMPSLVAEIGEVLKEHLTRIGMIKSEVDEHKQAYIEQKRAELAGNSNEKEALAYPENAQICKKCHTKAAVQMDGCLTCLSCGDSKCG